MLSFIDKSSNTSWITIYNIDNKVIGRQMSHGDLGEFDLEDVVNVD